LEPVVQVGRSASTVQAAEAPETQEAQQPDGETEGPVPEGATLAVPGPGLSLLANVGTLQMDVKVCMSDCLLSAEDYGDVGIT
jgi:hypothetical protein